MIKALILLLQGNIWIFLQVSSVILVAGKGESAVVGGGEGKIDLCPHSDGRDEDPNNTS